MCVRIAERSSIQVDIEEVSGKMMKTLFKIHSREKDETNKLVIWLKVANEVDKEKSLVVIKKAIRKLNHLFKREFTYEINISQDRNRQEEPRNR